MPLETTISQVLNTAGTVGGQILTLAIKKKRSWSLGRKTPSGRGETCDVLSIQRENDNDTKILGKSDTSKEKKKKKKKKKRRQTVVESLRVGVGAHACLVAHIARAWIKRVRLPILLVVS